MVSSSTLSTITLLSARRGPRKNDPTLAAAIDAYIQYCLSMQKESGVRSIISVLRGGQVSTKKAAGTPLARTHLGELKTHRVTPEDLTRWFNQRHEGLSDDARKRGASALSQLIQFSIARGWMDQDMLVACRSHRAADGERNWLTPETVDALVARVAQTEDPRFDSFWRFSFRLDLETGIRPEEKQRLVPGSLNTSTGRLRVRGKGRGDGKLRDVSVCPAVIEQWEAHVREYGLTGRSAVFFQRAWGFVDGKRAGWETIDLRKPCSQGAFHTMYAAISQMAQDELPADLAPAFSIGPRIMRRTFACLNCIAHARHQPGARDLMQLRDEMGHESLEVTSKYLSDVADYLARDTPKVGVLEMVQALTA